MGLCGQIKWEHHRRSGQPSWTKKTCLAVIERDDDGFLYISCFDMKQVNLISCITILYWKICPYKVQNWSPTTELYTWQSWHMQSNDCWDQLLWYNLSSISTFCRSCVRFVAFILWHLHVNDDWHGLCVQSQCRHIPPTTLRSNEYSAGYNVVIWSHLSSMRMLYEGCFLTMTNQTPELVTAKAIIQTDCSCTASL